MEEYDDEVRAPHRLFYRYGRFANGHPLEFGVLRPQTVGQVRRVSIIFGGSNMGLSALEQPADIVASIKQRLPSEVMVIYVPGLGYGNNIIYGREDDMPSMGQVVAEIVRIICAAYKDITVESVIGLSGGTQYVFEVAGTLANIGGSSSGPFGFVNNLNPKRVILVSPTLPWTRENLGKMLEGCDSVRGQLLHMNDAHPDRFRLATGLLTWLNWMFPGQMLRSLAKTLPHADQKLLVGDRWTRKTLAADLRHASCGNGFLREFLSWRRWTSVVPKGGTLYEGAVYIFQGGYDPLTVPDVADVYTSYGLRVLHHVEMEVAHYLWRNVPTLDAILGVAFGGQSINSIPRHSIAC